MWMSYISHSFTPSAPRDCLSPLYSLILKPNCHLFLKLHVPSVFRYVFFFFLPILREPHSETPKWMLLQRIVYSHVESLEILKPMKYKILQMIALINQAIMYGYGFLFFFFFYSLHSLNRILTDNIPSNSLLSRDWNSCFVTSEWL